MPEARAVGLALGYLADSVLGDPHRHHPVAVFGSIARHLETGLYADRRGAGVVYTAALVGAAAGLGVLTEIATRERPVARAAVTAAATWTVLGGRSLSREARAVQHHLDRGELAAARIQVTHLVGRDPSLLGHTGVARATVESVAENTSDAVVAPLLWGAVLGPAGLLGYRAVNTLDAMVGNRSARYVAFGWASARLDDLANLLPSRVTAGLVALTAPAVGGRTREVLTTWRRDAPQHPSPNAGPVEAAFAGALGVTLGGVNTYGEVDEDRGSLGRGPAPVAADVARAVRLSRLVGLGSLSLAVLVASAARPRRR
jgi:adenosylcobinamide-phosphate synthase